MTSTPNTSDRETNGTPDSVGRPRRSLGVPDAILVVLGVVVGAGIFAFPPKVAGSVPDAGTFLLAWVLGGLVSVVGALCYAELTTTYPDAGGEYHFLHRALGPGPSFLFAWARLAVIQTGSIAIHAFIIGDYVANLLGRGDVTAAVIAAATVVALTGLNLTGLRQGKWTQRLLTACVMTGVLLVCAAGFMPRDGVSVASSASGSSDLSMFGLAMVFVLLTYGGWNEAAYLSAEVKGGRRAMVAVMLGGIALVTALYVVVNLSYLRGLGLDGIAGSRALGADMVGATILGEWGRTLITLVVVIAAVGNMNATILTGARTNYALGRDFPAFRVLGRWNERTGVPVSALIVQGLMTLALVVFGALQRDGMASMVDYTTPVFWLFFLLTGASLLVLRRRDPAVLRPFRVPLYPLTPILFCAACAYMLYSSLAYVRVGALAGVAVLAAGIPLLLFARQRGRYDPYPRRGFEVVMPAVAAGDATVQK